MSASTTEGGCTLSLTVVHSLEEPPAGYEKSICLIGPSPTAPNVSHWWKAAVSLLEAQGYDGVVFVPEPRGERRELGPDEYTALVRWLGACADMADVILCWMPRDSGIRPGFTSSFQFGMWINSGKVVFGAPEEAYKTRFIEHNAVERKIAVAHGLAETVANALELLGEGAWREAGEREVPLLVWRTPEFQRWYATQRAANNRIDHARLIWTFMVGPRRRRVFFWVLWADVYIANEDRNKDNEVLLSRPDISVVVAYRPAERLEDYMLALVEEFRTPGGMVLAPPGGSSTHTGDHLEVAAEEIGEETGLVVTADRLHYHGSQQIMATLSVQYAHVYSLAITPAEEAQLVRQEADGVAYGILEDTERTFIRMRRIGDVLPLLDWSMRGMVLAALLNM